MRIRQLAAIAAIVCFGAALALAVLVLSRHFWDGLSALACLLLAIGAAWYGVRRRGAAAAAGLGAAVLLLAGSLLIAHHAGLLLIGVERMVIAIAASSLCARAAFLVHVALPTSRGSKARGALVQPKVRRRQGGALQPWR